MSEPDVLLDSEYIIEDQVKNSEALLKRVFPEKSNEQIKTISIFDENELLTKISELSKR